MNEHTVTVTFRYDCREHESVEEFVEACLTGNRSNAFARDVQVVETEDSE